MSIQSGTCSLQKSHNDCILRALDVALVKEHYSWRISTNFNFLLESLREWLKVPLVSCITPAMEWLYSASAAITKSLCNNEGVLEGGNCSEICIYRQEKTTRHLLENGKLSDGWFSVLSGRALGADTTFK